MVFKILYYDDDDDDDDDNNDDDVDFDVDDDDDDDDVNLAFELESIQPYEEREYPSAKFACVKADIDNSKDPFAGIHWHRKGEDGKERKGM